MPKTVVVTAIILFMLPVNAVFGNESIFRDVEKVKSCWLKCREEAIVAGNRALAYFKAKEVLDQPHVDAFATLSSFYSRVFLDRGDYKGATDVLESFLSRSITPTSANVFGAVHVNMGITHYSTGQLVLAEKAYTEALGIFRTVGKKDSEGIVLSNLANLSLERGRVTQAIEYYQSAIPLLEEYGKPGNLSTTLNNLGIQLTLKGQFALAEEYILRAGDLIKDSDNVRKKIQVIQAYIWWFIYAEKYPEALSYALENQTFIQNSDSQDLQAHFFVQLGTIREKTGDFSGATQDFEQGFTLASRINASSSAETASLGLARLAGKTGESQEASTRLRDLFTDAVDAQRFTFAETVHTQLIEALADEGQYEAAFSELSEYLEGFRGRVADDQENELTQYLALLETEEEKRKLVELQRDNVQQALDLSISERSRQQIQTVFIVTALILMSIAVWLVQGRRIASIKAAAAQERLNKKNVLLSEISHELKTPIAAIRLQIESLEHEMAAHPERSYALVYDKIGSLNRLIDDVFQLSKAESDELDLHVEAIHAQQFISEIAEDIASQLAAEKLSFSLVDHTSSDVVIDIDPRRIEQVFANLVSNTLRYTDSPGSCLLTLNGDDHRVVISYEDSAPGVSDTGLGRLFERLYREEASRSRASDGSGLGLSIVRAFVEAHGGSITATHSDLGGVRFDIELPAYPREN